MTPVCGRLASLAVAGGISLALAGAASAQPTGRAAAVAHLFASWCLDGEFDLASETQRAATAGLELMQDRTTPGDPSRHIAQRTWLAHDPTGDYMLSGEDVTNGAIHIDGCSITALDLAGPELTPALTALLGQPTIQAAPSDGPMTITWNVSRRGIAAAETVQVSLRYGAPLPHGAVVSYMDRRS
jgi:hypothetical protein